MAYFQKAESRLKSCVMGNRLRHTVRRAKTCHMTTAFAVDLWQVPSRVNTYPAETHHYFTPVSTGRALFSQKVNSKLYSKQRCPVDFSDYIQCYSTACVPEAPEPHSWNTTKVDVTLFTLHKFSNVWLLCFLVHCGSVFYSVMCGSVFPHRSNLWGLCGNCWC